MRDTVAREVRRLQKAHAEGTGPAVDRQTIISLIRKVSCKSLQSRLCSNTQVSFQQPHAEGTAPAVDWQTITSLIRKVGRTFWPP